MPSGRGYVYLGPDGEHAPNRGDRDRPVGSPEAGPGIYGRGLGRRIVGKMHPHNLFIDKGAVSGDFPKERETQIDSLSSGFPRSGCGTISPDNSR